METATSRDGFTSGGHSAKVTLRPAGRAHTTTMEDALNAAQAAELEQIKTAIGDSLASSVEAGATIEEALTAHALDIFNNYPTIAAALTADSFLKGFDLGAGR